MTKLASLILSGLASEQEMAGIDRKELLAIKSDSDAPHYRFVASDAVEKEGGEGEKRRYKHVASDETRDTMGDVIRVGGWELETFKKNPQLLWAHDKRGLPLGMVEDVRKGMKGGRKALLTVSMLHSPDINEMAGPVGKLLDAGALPGVSVGFVPIDTKMPQNDEERDAMGLGPFGVLYEKQQLLELSVVPVPANGSALQFRCLAAAGPVLETFEESLARELRGTLLCTKEYADEIRRRSIVVPAMSWKDTTDNGVTITSSSVPFISYGFGEIKADESQEAIMEALTALQAGTKELLDGLVETRRALDALNDNHLSDSTDAEAGAPKGSTDAPATPASEEDVTKSDEDDFITQIASALADDIAGEKE